ncbi:hypothetical protein J1614_011606 [Plenodomus biglobosus]|nr:hypothetical protein J1614_011606 [Plenodomus biglobosus]
MSEVTNSHNDGINVPRAVEWGQVRVGVYYEVAIKASCLEYFGCQKNMISMAMRQTVLNRREVGHGGDQGYSDQLAGSSAGNWLVVVEMRKRHGKLQGPMALVWRSSSWPHYGSAKYSRCRCGTGPMQASRFRCCPTATEYGGVVSRLCYQMMGGSEVADEVVMVKQVAWIGCVATSKRRAAQGIIAGASQPRARPGGGDALLEGLRGSSCILAALARCDSR